jgi:hypothetical protein
MILGVVTTLLVIPFAIFFAWWPVISGDGSTI